MLAMVEFFKLLDRMLANLNNEMFFRRTDSFKTSIFFKTSSKLGKLTTE